MASIDGARLYAVKVALDPSPTQARLLASHAGAARFVFNRMLAEVKSTLAAREWERRLLGGPLTQAQGWSLAALRKTWNANKDVWAPWWSEVSKEAFNHGLQALADALDNWATSRNGTRKGRSVGFPRFRGRRAKRSFSYTTGSFRPNADGVSAQLPRVGRVHTHERLEDLVRAIDAGHVTVKRATVSFSGGRWWCSFTVADCRPLPARPKAHAVVGVVDLLVAGTPDGDEVLRVRAPKSMGDAQVRLARLQRKAAHQQRGSNRWKATMRRIGRLHTHAADIRRDAIHKATTELARTAATVVVEDLNVSGMGTRNPGTGRRGRGMNRAVADAALAEVRRQLTYKTSWNHGTLVTADRWFPSSKTCSGCDSRKPKLSLSERTFRCPHCGLEIDRDLNAAVNLAHLAVCDVCRQWDGDAKPGRGADRKTTCPRRALAGGCEASTHHGRTPGQSGTATSREVAA